MASPGLSLDGANNSTPHGTDAPPKKSRFKRPSWATAVKQAPAPEQDKEEDTFNRSKETLAQFKRQQAEEAARAKAKAEEAEKDRVKQLEQAGKAKLKTPAERSEDGKASKRRRLNSEGPVSASSDSDANYASADDKVPKRNPTRSRSRSSSSDELYTNPAKSVISPKAVGEKNETIIINMSDDSDDNEEDQVPGSSKSGNKPKPEPQPKDHLAYTEESDDKQDTQSSTQVPTPRATISPAPPTEPPRPDPTLTLMIHSRIPGTNPLLCKRNLNQRIREVLDAWLSRQTALNEAQKAEVFLTWRGGRVFPISSCKSLGIGVNETGEVFFKGKGKMEAPSEENAQIAFEAVTQEILDRDKKEKEVARQKLISGGQPETPKEEVVKDENKIKIVLKAKGYPDFKLVVRPHTKFLQIANVYRTKHKVAEDKEIFCMFDGDKLEPEDDVQSLELEQEESLEVVIK